MDSVDSPDNVHGYSGQSPVSNDNNNIRIIISLFQENNIFGMNASLTYMYGPRLQR